MFNLLKQFAKSKTILVNGLTLVAGVIGYISGHDVIAQNPDLVAALVAGLGAVNVVLRLLTSVSVFEKVSILGK